MLVLQRKAGQRVRITTPSGDVIWVTLVEVRQGRCPRVRLGFTAAPEVEVWREELIAAPPAPEPAPGP